MKLGHDRSPRHGCDGAGGTPLLRVAPFFGGGGPIKISEENGWEKEDEEDVWKKKRGGNARRMTGHAQSDLD